ncbi:MAG: hypothetical protein QXP42_02770 [Candidatus Micrarchaeia archaeon]
MAFGPIGTLCLGGTILFGILAVLVSILAILLFAIIGALIGAVTGYILQHVPILGPLVIKGFELIGVQNPDLAAIGAMLGFVGGFFKSIFPPTKKD